jgi:thiaminase (transcriptional activator TenA)
MLVTQMYAATEDLRYKIHQHDFNQKLANGSLDTNIFKHYIQQDALYLADFARALALLAARLTNNDYARELLDFALQAIWAEKDLHQLYIQDQTILTQLTPNPACFMYTNFILKTAAMASIEEAIACLLPCFVIYRDVGKDLVTCVTNQNHPYYAWINLYSGDEFSIVVDKMCLITNELAQNTTPNIHAKMIAAFVKSTQLEWLFWDDAYHQREWPC